MFQELSIFSSIKKNWNDNLLNYFKEKLTNAVKIIFFLPEESINVSIYTEKNLHEFFLQKPTKMLVVLHSLLIGVQFFLCLQQSLFGVQLLGFQSVQVPTLSGVD